MKKVIIIGVDGATPDLINKWIKQDKLPNFKKIQKNGVYGKLKSTIPPFSAPAWTSIVTGCNPGKHGIYGFEKTVDQKSHLITSKYRKVPAIWNYLTYLGKKSIIINVPVSYPPVKINGAMITGLLTPSPDSDFTYPESIKKRLQKGDFGKYELESIWLEDFPRSHLAKNKPDKLLDILLKQMESRANAAIKLMKEINWDFTMVVLRGTDTAQHFLFHDDTLLYKCYKKVDELIGKIMGAEPESTFFIVSDHGFQKIKKILYPDNVLYRNNLLVPHNDPSKNVLTLFWNLIYRISRLILSIIPANKIKHSGILKNILFSSASKDKIYDLSKTKAFCTSEGRGIQINSEDSYSKGIVKREEFENIKNEIIKIFSELKDPETGKEFVSNVYRGNQIYGKNAHNPLDLVLDFKKGYTSSEGFRLPNNIFNVLNIEKKKFPILFGDDPVGRSGDHAPYGIFFAYGKNIKPANIIKEPSVEDILPTVFAEMDVAIPNNIDGKIHHEIFIKKPVIKTVDWKLYLSDKKILSTKEMEKINTLKNMFKSM